MWTRGILDDQSQSRVVYILEIGASRLEVASRTAAVDHAPENILVLGLR